MIVFWVVGGVVIFFGFVIAFGAPYVPTMRRQVDAALDLLDLKPDQTLLELGSGDGRVARRAAERGLKVVGYELNPILVIWSRIATFRYRDQVKIIWGDYWQTTWPPTDGIFVFLIDHFMEKLDKKIIQEYKVKPTKLVSFAFKIPGKVPIKAKQGVFLYRYN